MGGPPMPPREAVLFVPPNLTGMIIGKGGAQIKMLRQDSGERDGASDLQKSNPPEGDGSATIVITGANGNDVMVRYPHGLPTPRPHLNSSPHPSPSAMILFWIFQFHH